MAFDLATHASATGRASSASPPSGTSNQAFSLVELVLVVAIVGIVSAIAIPRYGNSLARFRADAAARRIVADLAYAQSQARSSSSSRTVQFDAATDRYTLLGVPGLNNPAHPYEVALKSDPFQARIVSATFDDALDVADALDEVVFDGFGMPDSDGMVVISAGTFTKIILIDPDSGKAQVQ